MRLQCPVCGGEVDVDVSNVEKPRRGLAELVIIHGDHAFKVFIDSEGMVRRVAPIRVAVVSGGKQPGEQWERMWVEEVPDLRYIIYVYDDHVDVVDSGGSIRRLGRMPISDVLQLLGV